MKKIAITPLSILLTLILTACATPTASPTLTSIPTRTPTILPTETAPPTSTSTPEPTATLTQTDTLEPTATEEPTPEAQPLPTPEVSLPERIASLDNLPQSTKDVLLPNMESQFPIVEEYDAWRLTCIGGDFVTHEPTIKLPTGKEISHTFACQYRDVEGQDQEVHFPVYTYDLAEDTAMFLGHKANDLTRLDEPDERIFRRIKGLTEGWDGYIEKLANRGWSGPDHVFIVRFAYPEAGSENYLAPDIEQLVTPERLAEFAQTGDPSLLTIEVNDQQIALLLADGDAGVSFDNTWGAEQKAITGPLLED